MAHQWEMQMTMDRYGMGYGGSYSNYSNINTSQMNGASMNPGYYYGAPSTNDHSVRVDDMLDFSNAQELFPTASASALADQNHLIAGQGDRSNTASARNSVSSYDSFANEFYVPSEEAAELEWLSKFVDDSYSDMPSNMAGANMASYMNASNDASQLGAENSSASAGRGVRSKRSRAASAVAAAWHALIPPTQSSPSSSTSSSDFPTKPSKGSANRGKKTGIGNGNGELGLEGGVRRCTHCASEKTPQWRTGPLGPKTLCNACGVRYKSGRLMPEYRPAASPTFVLTQHSNSHRKVMELRRQKELMVLRHRDNPSAAAAAMANAAAARPELLYHDYGVC